MRWLFCMLVLSACGHSAQDAINGASGTSGSNGASGINGSNGKNGKDSAIFKLKTADGIILPGIIAMGGNSVLWNESEGTQTYYVNGMQKATLYFASNNCSGQAYSNNAATITDAKFVFAVGTQRYIADGAPTTVTINSSFNTSCVAGLVGALTVSSVSAYTGEFPLNAQGPFTIVEE